MTTTEPTIADLDDQLGRLDGALATLRAQKDGIQVEQRQLEQKWAERAAWGDVDAELTNSRKGYEGSLEAVDTAIGLNRAKFGEITAQRAELVAAQQHAADRKQYQADVAAFAERSSAEAIIGRLLGVEYRAMRASNAELAAVVAEQERLNGEAGRLGCPPPPDKTTVAFGMGPVEGAPIELLRAALHMGGWPREQRAAEVIGEYVRMRAFAASRENPNEAVPTWSDVIEAANG